MCVLTTDARSPARLSTPIRTGHHQPPTRTRPRTARPRVPATPPAAPPPDRGVAARPRGRPGEAGFAHSRHGSRVVRAPRVGPGASRQVLDLEFDCLKLTQNRHGRPSPWSRGASQMHCATTRSDRASHHQDCVTRTSPSPPHQVPQGCPHPAAPGSNARDTCAAPSNRRDVRRCMTACIELMFECFHRRIAASTPTSSQRRPWMSSRGAAGPCAACRVMALQCPRAPGVDGVRPGAYGEASSNTRSNVVLVEPPTPDRQHPGIGLCLGEGSAGVQADPPAQPSSPARDHITARRTQ